MSTYLDAHLGDRWKGLYNPRGRGFPDVAAQGVKYHVFSGGKDILVSGTSASAPMFAALVSLLNNARLAQGRAPLGFLNLWLYSVGKWGLVDIVLYEKLGPDGRNDPDLRWLQPLWDASKTLVTATGDELDNALAAVALGRRNGTEFIAKKADHPPPFFGIGHPFVSTLLQQTPDHVDRQDVERLRFLALKLGLRPDEAIIRVQGRQWAKEYATAVPHSCRSFQSLGPKHGRWIRCLGKRKSIRGLSLGHGHPLHGHSRLRTDPSCRCHADGHNCHAEGHNCYAEGHNCHEYRCPCIYKGTTCSESCHASSHELSDECLCCLQPSSLEASQTGAMSNSLYGCANLPLQEFIVSVESDPCSQIDPNQRRVSPPSLNLGIGHAQSGAPLPPSLLVLI